MSTNVGAAVVGGSDRLLTLAVAYVICIRHPGRRDGPLLVATGFTLCTGGLALQSVFPTLRDIAGLTFNLHDAFLLHAVLSLPSGRLVDRASRWTVAASYVVVVTLSPIQRMLQYAAPPPCRACISHVIGWHAPAVAAVVSPLTGVVGATISIFAALLLAYRYRRETVAGRLVIGPVLAASVITAAVVAYTNIGAYDGAAYIATLTFRAPYAHEDIAALLTAIAFCLPPIAYLYGDVRAGRLTGAVGQLLPRLNDEGSLAELREHVARALGDPSVQLLDPSESPASGPRRAITDVTFGGRVLARIEHDSVLLAQRGALDAASAALGLVLGRRQLALETAEQETKLAAAVDRAVRSGQRERRALLSDVTRLKTAFAAYVDPALTEQVLVDGVHMQGREVEVTAMFLDVRGFTAYAESVSAAEVVAMLNRLWETVVPVVVEHGGHANKFMGDGMLAVFGAPVPHADHARRAIDAAVAAVRAVSAEFGSSVRLGVGLNSGPAVAGTVGGGGHVEFAVVGDTINTASRIEQATKQSGDTILLSATMRDAAGPDHVVVARPAVELPGKRMPVDLYALLIESVPTTRDPADERRQPDPA
jgi:class 3 adenylate cyclase